MKKHRRSTVEAFSLVVLAGCLSLTGYAVLTRSRDPEEPAKTIFLSIDADNYRRCYGNEAGAGLAYEHTLNYYERQCNAAVFCGTNSINLRNELLKTGWQCDERDVVGQCLKFTNGVDGVYALVYSDERKCGYAVMQR